MNNIVNKVPYLRTSRQFPEDLRQLCIEMNKSYVDIANAVNNRTISIFPTTNPSVTGESWYLNQNQKQQTLRKIYPFGAIAPGAELDIPTGLSLNQIGFTRIYGSVVTNVPDYRPLPYIDAATLTTSMTILVGPVAGILQIRVVLGSTAAAVTSGIAVLEFLSNT